MFRKLDSQDPMTPSTFTWRFKLILNKNGLPEKLNVHSLRHSNASLLVANETDVARKNVRLFDFIPPRPSLLDKYAPLVLI